LDSDGDVATLEYSADRSGSDPLPYGTDHTTSNKDILRGRLLKVKIISELWGKTEPTNSISPLVYLSITGSVS
jgi:hypothetical protein